LGRFHVPPETHTTDLASCFPFPAKLGLDPTGSSLGLSFPSALAGFGGLLVAGLPGPLRSAFRVWLPSWRFTPPKPWLVMFHTNSALGIWPFGAFPSGQVLAAFPPPVNPPAVHPPVSPGGNHQAGPTSRDFWALTLARVPCAAKAVGLNGHRLLPWAFGPFQGRSPKTWSAVPRRLLSRA
jgi:hypothetical protein